MKRLANEFLAHIGSIRIRRIDEIDSEFNCAAQHGDCFGSVGWLAPNAGTGELHRTEAEAANPKIAANCEGAALAAGCGSGRRERCGVATSWIVVLIDTGALSVLVGLN